MLSIFLIGYGLILHHTTKEKKQAYGENNLDIGLMPLLQLDQHGHEG